MKKHTIILSLIPVVFMLLTSCGKRVKIVPEISRALMDETLVELKQDLEPMPHIFIHEGDLVYLTHSGRISRFNAQGKMVTFLYNLNTPLTSRVFHDKDRLLLQKKGSRDIPSSWFIFDLSRMKEYKMLDHLKADKVVGMKGEIISCVYQGRFFLYHYPSEKKIFERDITVDTEFFNCEYAPGYNSLVILSTHHLYRFDLSHNTMKTTPLKIKAGSPFLLDGVYAYFGSAQRQLVRHSVFSKSPSWKFKIADYLKVKPVKAGRFISITPEDHNIYFFTKQGTLYWWEKLESTRLRSPLALKENVVVMTWNGSARFFNFKKKRSLSFSAAKLPFSNMVSLGEYVYMVAHEGANLKEEATAPKSIFKMGNNFGAEVITTPKDIIPMGRSIKFKIKGINLVEPRFQVTIRDPQGRTVLEKNFEDAGDDNPSFVWVPDEAVKYKMVLDIAAENKKDLKVEEELEVLDVTRILNEYYYNVHKYLDTGIAAQTPAP